MGFMLFLTTEARNANMGWIEPPPYFCTVSETGREVAEKCTKTSVGSLAEYKFVDLTEVNSDIEELKKKDTSKELCNYILEVYMDDYIVLDILKIKDQIHHFANAIMTGIHDMFTPDKDDQEDAISIYKMLKKEAAWTTVKNVLGFEFDGNPGEHTMWLTEDRRTDILTKFKKWIREG